MWCAKPLKFEMKKKLPEKKKTPDHPVMAIEKGGNITIPQNDNHSPNC
jgi:hypothetical protein